MVLFTAASLLAQAIRDQDHEASQNASHAPTNSLVGRAFPGFEKLEFVKGEAFGQLRLSKYQNNASYGGRRILVIELWSTTCQPCVQSIPMLSNIQRKYRDQGVYVLGISVEPLDRRKEIESFVNAQGLRMDYYVALDPENEGYCKLMQPAGTNSVPFAVLVDVNDTIVFVGHVGDVEMELAKLVKNGGVGLHTPPTPKVPPPRPSPAQQRKEAPASARMPPSRQRDIWPRLGKAKALYGYRSTHPMDLSFEKDDVIEVCGHESEDWWNGRLDRTKRFGSFPASYVQELADSSPAQTRERPTGASYNPFADDNKVKDVVVSCSVSQPPLPPRPALPPRPGSNNVAALDVSGSRPLNEVEITKAPVLPSRRPLDQRPSMNSGAFEKQDQPYDAFWKLSGLKLVYCTVFGHTVPLMESMIRTIEDRRFNSMTDFEAIDAYARACPEEYTQSVRDLAQYLCEQVTDEVDKLRCIFAWIAANISYDLVGLRTGKRGDQSAEGVLKSRLSVCQGYATLFCALGKAAGLDVLLVSGVAKGAGFEPGDTFPVKNGRLDPPSELAHAWNAVFVRGEWRFIDSTWGAGYCSDQFHRCFTPYWFLVHPKNMILTHFPNDAREQYLDPVSVSAEEFVAFPCLKEAYHGFGCELLQPRGMGHMGWIEVEDNHNEDGEVVVEVGFRCQEELQLFSSFTFPCGRTTKFGGPSRDGPKVKIRLRCPGPGVGRLELFASTKTEYEEWQRLMKQHGDSANQSINDFAGGKRLQHEVAYFAVRSNRGSDAPYRAFPTTYGKPVQQAGKNLFPILLSPLFADLRVGQSYRFHIDFWGWDEPGDGRGSYSRKNLDIVIWYSGQKVYRAPEPLQRCPDGSYVGNVRIAVVGEVWIAWKSDLFWPLAIYQAS